MTDISYLRRDGVVFATYNRPEALNAFRNQTYAELHQILLDFTKDDASKVLILSGRGRAFSAGHDLKELSGSDLGDLEELNRHLQKTQEITRLLYQSNKPSIAAINGLAVGVGIEIALACTVRIAVEESYFQFTEVKRGLFQTNGAMYLLPRIVGLGRAAQMLLTGDKISANDALMAGLITRKVQEDELLPAAEHIAAEFLHGSEQSLRLIQQGLRLALQGSMEEVMEFEIKSNLELVEAKGHLKGVHEFADQKNTPE
jgi:enoyl-CoA hydratase/carnithine racemase